MGTADIGPCVSHTDTLVVPLSNAIHIGQEVSCRAYLSLNAAAYCLFMNLSRKRYSADARVGVNKKVSERCTG